MDISDSHLFAKSSSEAVYFPQNVVRPFVSQHHLDAFTRRLNEQETRIFCKDGKAAVDMWEYIDSLKGELQLHPQDHS